MNGKVWLVGAGPGDPGLLTLKGRRAIERCDVLVYDALVASAIVDLAPTGCERIYVGKRAGAHARPQAEIEALLVERARAGKRVCRLKGGDVFVFGRGGEEARALRAAGIPFVVVPGVSSAIAAAAYAGIPVTHRDHNASFTVATGHEKPGAPSRLDFAALADPHATTIFLMGLANVERIAAELIAHGRSAETPIAIVSEGTTPAQRTLVATLGSVGDALRRTPMSAPATVIVGDVVREREQIRWFDDGALFGARALVVGDDAVAQRFADALWDAGAEPATIATRGLRFAGTARLRADAERAAVVAFASEAAVRAWRSTRCGDDALAGAVVVALDRCAATALAGRADLVATGDDDATVEALGLLVATRAGAEREVLRASR